MAAALGLLLGQGVNGWYWLSPDNWNVMQWRMPRVLAAAASGLMLAVAGTLLQRLSANPMASPEVLGISGGCAIALILGIFLLPAPTSGMLVGVGTWGLCHAADPGGTQSPQRLRTGAPAAHRVAVTALFDAVRSVMLAGGDPRGQQVIAWLAGSTYYVDLTSALVVGTLAALLTLCTLPLTRWLDILPWGRLPPWRWALLSIVLAWCCCCWWPCSRPAPPWWWGRSHSSGCWRRTWPGCWGCHAPAITCWVRHSWACC